MRYALLVNDLPRAYESLDAKERERLFAEYAALAADPRVVAGEQLHPASAALTVRGDATTPRVSAGPPADTGESFAGYYVVDVADAEEALAIARDIPAIRLGGSVEVRGVVER